MWTGKKIIIVLSLNNEFPHTPATVPSKLLIQMIWTIHGTAHTKLKHLIPSCNFLSMNNKTNKKRSVINKKMRRNITWIKSYEIILVFWFDKSVFMWFIGLSVSSLFTLGFIRLLVERRYLFELSKGTWSGAKKKILFLLLLFIRGFLCDSIDHLWVARSSFREVYCFNFCIWYAELEFIRPILMFAVINLYCVHSHKWNCVRDIFKKEEGKIHYKSDQGKAFRQTTEFKTVQIVVTKGNELWINTWM